MAWYLISFDDGAMDFIPEEEMPAVGDAARAVIRDAQEAGVWVFAGGVYPLDEVSVRVVAPDGTVTDGAESKAYIGGVTIIDVASREEALKWAAKIAVACRCPQDVREFMPDPAVGNSSVPRLGQRSQMSLEGGLSEVSEHSLEPPAARANRLRHRGDTHAGVFLDDQFSGFRCHRWNMFPSLSLQPAKRPCNSADGSSAVSRGGMSLISPAVPPSSFTRSSADSRSGVSM